MKQNRLPKQNKSVKTAHVQQTKTHYFIFICKPIWHNSSTGIVQYCYQSKFYIFSVIDHCTEYDGNGSFLPDRTCSNFSAFWLSIAPCCDSWSLDMFIHLCFNIWWILLIEVLSVYLLNNVFSCIPLQTYLFILITR